MAAHYSNQTLSARYQPMPRSGPEMARIGSVVISSIKARLLRGMDVNDAPVPVAYWNSKRSKRPQPKTRDWLRTGRTHEAMAVLSASTNFVEIGFIGSRANMIAAINNARYKQFGISRTDLQAAIDEMNRLPTYAIAKAA